MPKQRKKKTPQVASTVTEGIPTPEPQQPQPPQQLVEPPTAGTSSGGGEEGKKGKGVPQVVGEPSSHPKKEQPPPEQPQRQLAESQTAGKKKGKKGKGVPQVVEEPAPPPKKGQQEKKKKPPVPAGDVAAAEDVPRQAGRETVVVGKQKGKEPTPPIETQQVQPPRAEPHYAPVVPSAWGQPKGPSPPSEQRGPTPSRGPMPTGPVQQGPQRPGVSMPRTASGPVAQVVQPQQPRAVSGSVPQAAQQPIPRGVQEPRIAQEAPVVASPPAVTQTRRDDTALRERQIAPARKGFEIPVRKDINKGGSLGMRTVVETNHLALDLSRLRTKEAYHYDVAVNPDKPKRLIRLAVEEFRKKKYPNRYPAFDGRKNLVSAQLLPFGHSVTETVNVYDEERQKNLEYSVTIQFVARVDLSSLHQYMRAGSSLVAPQTAIQMIDIVLRSAPSLNFVPVGRSYFTPPAGEIVKLGDGMEMWVGLFQSVNLGWRPFVNVDVVHKAFPTNQSVLAAISEVCSGSRGGPVDLNHPLDSYQRKDFGEYISKLKVDYMLPNQPQTKRTFRVNSVADSANDLTFKQDNGTSIRVADYFRTVKKVALRYPHLPCLHVGSLQRPNPIYLPVEFCTVTKGQATQRIMNERQTSELIKKAATSTMERKRKIVDALRKMNFNQDPVVQDFGLTVNESFSKIPARILPPPTLAYKDERPVRPSKGVWRAAEFLKGQSLDKWIIVNLDRRTQEDKLWNLYKSWESAGKNLGMNIAQPVKTVNMRAPSKYERDLNRIKEELKSFFLQHRDMQLIVVVVPDAEGTYANVKQLAELNVGVLTQCVKAKTVFRMNFSTAANLLLKVNSKLNGVNHQLSRNVRPKCLETPAIIVGADVTHPSPTQINIPSVAAVCASHDPNGFRYNIQFRLQPPRTEIIQDLEAIMRNHLIYFNQQTRQKPNRILFFRDGVSEGEFSKVLNAELTAIRRACMSLNQDYRPLITFLVVQKRHHTRFFPTRKEDEDGKNCNVPAGTIVDTEITHPTEIDFYLVSHASIQGVSRPTKYHCLWDDSKMTDDELQQLTYFLCHMFSRCTRSVSYPAPTYYAHLAAYRGRVYIHGREIQLNSLENEQKLSTIKEDFIRNSPMFFV